jgi:hypothetical protein
MLKKLLSITLATAIATQAAATDFSGGQFYFRYRVLTTDSAPVDNPDDPSQAKDITAFFIGSVGDAFSEKLPMKSDWEDDNWQVVEGSLPGGISFDSSTLMFTGTPTTEEKAVVVEMRGYDTKGEAVASAEVTFDMYQLPSNRKQVDYYAHTNSYSFNQVDIPVGSVDHWLMLRPAPDGIQILGRNFDGTPTKAGAYPVLVEGFDYLDNAVAAIWGNFTVEDAPRFAKMVDKLVSLPNVGTTPPTSGTYHWSTSVSKILRPIASPDSVRYYVEVDPAYELPGTIVQNSDSHARNLTGDITEYNDQAKIRYRAVDSDGVNGYSDWFMIGSKAPKPRCSNPYPITWTINAFNSYQIPLALAGGSAKYEVTSGFSLPNGLTLDVTTGLISGAPTATGDTTVPITITLTTSGTQNSYSCGPFTISVVPAPVTLTINNLGNERVGRPFDATVVPGGALVAPYSVAIDDPASLPDGVTFDPTSGKITGSTTETGPFTATFIVTNGNGVRKKASKAFVVYKKLVADDIGLISVKRYNTSNMLAVASFDEMGVVPGAAGSVDYPITSLRGDLLPTGFGFDSQTRVLSGGTKLPVDKYGPFHIHLIDGSGDTTDGVADSNDFWIEVTDRDDMIANETVAPSFTVNFDEKTGKQPFSVTEPKLIQDLPLVYTINQSVPDGLIFDGTSGVITGRARKVETISGYKITVTDSEGYTKDSAEFAVTVKDPDQPAAKAMAPITKNVTGLIPSFLTTLPLDFSATEDTLIGGVTGVTYTDYSPVIGGLTYSNGILSGNPTQEFDGMVSLNFTDGAGRPGSAKVHLTILPYPMVTTEQPSYNLPRLSDADDLQIKGKTNTGYFGGVTFALSPSSKALPKGLSPVNGQIVGSTNVSKGAFPGIVIRATDKTTGIWDDTDPFPINVTDQAAMAFALPQHELTFQVTPDDSGSYTLAKKGVFVPAPKPTGSYVKPLIFSIDDPHPSWVGINPQTGELTGTPTRLGTEHVTIRVSDSDTIPSSKIDDVAIKTTLSGFVIPTAKAQLKTVRVGESFKTLNPFTTSNAVGSVTLDSSSVLPDTVTFDAADGYFHGNVDTAGSMNWAINGIDEDQRGFAAPATVAVNVIDALKLQLDTPLYEATQYSAEQPVNITFKPADNVIGQVSYKVVGELPGTLFYKENGVWNHFNADNSVETVTQISDLPSDALVFDTTTLTLRGIPSKSGTFDSAYLLAIDDHKNTYNDASRDATNVASVGFTINVAPVADLTVSKSVETEAIQQFTSKPVGKITVTGAAYGKPLTWEKISESLPQGISVVAETAGLTFDGYPTEKGVFAGAIYRATDALGRHIDTPAIAITVGDRGALTLTPSVNPKPMIVNTGDADMTITATNTAFGKPVTWTLAPSEVAKLPVGVTYAIKDANLHFSGVSSVRGSYKNILVHAVDDLGEPQDVEIAFSVYQDGDPITLSPGAQELTVRTGETFDTALQTPTGTIGAPVYNLNVDPLPADFSFNANTGVLHGQVPTTGTYTFAMNLEDTAQRLMDEPVRLKVTVKPALSIVAPIGSFVAKQFSAAEPISISFQGASDVIGTANYQLTGTFPGTYYIKQSTGWVHPLPAGGQQVVSNPSDLAPDALVFDPAALTLEGIPSKSGIFDDIKLIATDDHEDKYTTPSDPTRVDANRAETSPITITVAAADALTVANMVAGTETNAESLYQYQTQTSASTVVNHAAYGRAVSWTKVSGTLPVDISNIVGANSITYAGYPSVISTSNVVWKATDAAGREITSTPLSFTVLARKPLAVLPSSNPKGVIVSQNVDLLVTAGDPAYGLPVTWTVSGTLPPNVTYTIDDAGVHFSGIPNIVQKYTGIVVTAKDAVNATASASLTINVLSPADAIVLNVSNVTTKVGFGYKMEPPFAATALSTSNTYGKLKFSSTDLASVSGLGLDRDTGAIQGTAAATGKFTFSLSVSDETLTRLTAKSVVVEVIPNLKIVAPTQVTVTQGASTPVTVDTSNNIGTVTYKKGAGTWPDGIEVDQNNGTISGTPTGSPSTFANLTITGTDGIGDIQNSNVFSIVVKPIEAVPQISNIASNKMTFGTVGVQAVSFTPTVVDSKNSKPWIYAGTVYSINHDLSPYGLSFDTATGTISGTPTTPIVFTDMVIKVTSGAGDSAQTTPFWFGITPVGTISAVVGQKLAYIGRISTTFTSEAPLFENAFGTLTYTATGLPTGTGIGSTTGKVTGSNPTITGTYTVVVTVTDAFGRKGTFTYTVTLNAALKPSWVAGGVQLYTDVSYPSSGTGKLAIPTSVGKIGNLTYNYLALPPGLTFDATTGQLAGTPTITNGSTGQSFSVTLSVTDDFDGATGSAITTFNVDTTTHLYWRLINTGLNNASGPGATLYDSSGAIINSLIATTTNTNLFDQNSATNSGFNLGTNNDVKFTSPQNLNSIVFVQTSASDRGLTAVTVGYSNDGFNWEYLPSFTVINGGNGPRTVTANRTKP